ncbi:hypothetical protein BC751_3027 [Cecembia calidifontis]|uniref:Uncharacterized protein n=1 Tax=Cecembia calidifontis TaxID=1187080 RepID=A0A4Q7PB12_9BACT|nr:hypothetical protein BC751_3027 [Cecembia calidifontis]
MEVVIKFKILNFAIPHLNYFLDYFSEYAPQKN